MSNKMAPHKEYMKNLPIKKNTINERLEIIEQSLQRLREIKELSPGRFMLDDNFAIAEHYLRYAIEATFDICAHILSRIPGVKADEYRKMAIEMGKQEIVPIDFAMDKLEKMGKYRNRLTHFYFEINPNEMYGIIQDDLEDFEIFMKHIKKFLKKQ